MKLGLLTDIHEHFESLRTAVDRFRSEKVEKVVVIGDVFQMGQRIEEICRLLTESNAIGVWDNHDFGLSCDPEPKIRDKSPTTVINGHVDARSSFLCDLGAQDLTAAS